MYVVSCFLYLEKGDNDMSNLPPGVTDSMIPGNRPEDQEEEITIILTKGDIIDIIDCNMDNYNVIWDNIVDQIRDLYGDL